jgi:D-3-phosphoglycerate dehydrogenase
MFKVALVTDKLEDLPAWISRELAENNIELKAKKCESPEAFTAFAEDADFVWTRGLNTVITDESLPKLKNCKAVMRSGSGLDGIPLDTARKAGITVLNTPEAIAEMVAEHAVALIMALVRQVPQMDKTVRNGKWDGCHLLMQSHLTGQTLGLVGFGLIARKVAKMLAGFNLELLVFDPYANDNALKEFAARRVSLDELLRNADFVSLHCPLTPETNHLIGEKELKLMKDNAFLINTSRGDVVDEAALINALENKWISGAALDVLSQEPPAFDNKLLQLENTIISPHLAAFSDKFEHQFWKASVEKIISFKSGFNS